MILNEMDESGGAPGGILLNIANACQTCHRWPEEELKARVETIQGRTFELRNLAMNQRRAQFYLDFIPGM